LEKVNEVYISKDDFEDILNDKKELIPYTNPTSNSKFDMVFQDMDREELLRNRADFTFFMFIGCYLFYDMIRDEEYPLSELAIDYLITTAMWGEKLDNKKLFVLKQLLFLNNKYSVDITSKDIKYYVIDDERL